MCGDIGIIALVMVGEVVQQRKRSSILLCTGVVKVNKHPLRDIIKTLENLSALQVVLIDQVILLGAARSLHLKVVRNLVQPFHPELDGEDNWKLLRPDFIVFSEINGVIKPSIVDPHGTHLSDSLPKLRGLATFAQKHGGKFYRIDAVAQIKGDYRKLDMLEERVRQAVEQADNVEGLFTSPVSDEYR